MTLPLFWPGFNKSSICIFLFQFYSLFNRFPAFPLPINQCPWAMADNITYTQF